MPVPEQDLAFLSFYPAGTTAEWANIVPRPRRPLRHFIPRACQYWRHAVLLVNSSPLVILPH